MSKLPEDPEDHDLFQSQVLNDTGAFCRQILDMDTDRDQNGEATSGIGQGGVRSWGPHQEIVQFIDDWSPDRPFKQLMCPRFAYKSSIVEGLICRLILRHPNITILLMMANKNDAAHRVAVIKKILEENELIRGMFPDLKLQGSKYSFTTSLRTNLTLQTPTLRAGSPDNIPTGGRFNFICFDDLADDVNTRTELGLRRGIETVKDSIFLRGKDAIVLNVATPRHDGDVSAWIAEEEGWHKCVHLDVGLDLVQNSEGKLEWVGDKPTWPHLTKKFLDSQIAAGLDYSTLMAQYKLRVVAGLHSAFKRNQFQGFQFKREEHSQLTGYLLTDVATGMHKDSALNVLMYVGLDERNRAHILDLEIGQWQMMEFCDRFMKMRAHWTARVSHQAELLEVTSANQGYRSYLLQLARDQSVRLNLIQPPRNQSAKSKDARILGTQYRFQAREVFVNNELSGRTWVHNGELRLIWDPEGYQDPSPGALPQPDGELVMQFIRHPFHKLKDIPDTFAMINEQDKATGRAYCFWRRPSSSAVPNASLRRSVTQAGPTRKGYTSRFYERASRRR